MEIPTIVCNNGNNIPISLDIYEQINNNEKPTIDLSDKYYGDSESIKKIIDYMKKNFNESYRQFYENKIREINEQKANLTEQLNILNQEVLDLNQHLIDNIENSIVGRAIQNELSRIIIIQEKNNKEIRKLNQKEIFLKGEFTFNKFFDFKKLNTRQTCNILCCADVLGIDEIINNYLKYNKINNLLIGMIEYYKIDLFNKISNILGYV